MNRSKTINLSNLKAHSGEQSFDFEELCCQLFRVECTTPGWIYYRRPRGGDRGAEAVFRDSGQRVVAAVQAKFFKGAVPWSKITQSVHRTLEDNAGEKALKRYVICLSKVACDAAWIEHKAAWRQHAVTLGYPATIEFEHWDASEIDELLKQPRFKPQRAHWFDLPELTLERCASISREAIKKLKQMGRYFKDAHTPVDTEDTLHAFMRTEHARLSFIQRCQQGVGAEREISWHTLDDWPTERQQQWHGLRSRMDALVLVLGDGSELPTDLQAIREATRGYDEARGEFFHWMWSHLKVGEGQQRSSSLEVDYQTARSHAEGSINWGFSEHDIAATALCSGLLVRGKPGGGKTHLLAAFCESYLESGGAVLFREGAKFLTSADLKMQIKDWLDIAADITFDQFLDAFDALAQSSGRPGLLCIDGLNESKPSAIWQTGLDELFAEIRRRPHLKLIVSCRRDNMETTLPPSLLINELPVGWCAINHEGLGPSTYAAMASYFKRFKVQGTQSLVWRQDFAEPLYLKLFCEAYEDQEPPIGSQSIAQVIPKWAEVKGRQLLGPSPSAGTKLTALLSAFARAMVESDAMQITREEAICLIDAAKLGPHAIAIYEELLKEMVVNEFPVGHGIDASLVVRFVYHRVLDYFAVHALWPPGTSLPPLLGQRLSGNALRGHRAELFAILSLRLPEEVGVELPDILTDDWLIRSHIVSDAFLQSLPSRTKLTDTTAGWLGRLLGQPGTSRRFDILLPMAALPHSPWNADQIHERLRQMPLLERERYWTHDLNQRLGYEWCGATGLRKMAEELPPSCLMSDEVVLLLGTALAWMCSTMQPSEYLRTAQALARLLPERLAVALRLVQRFADIDDPQVVEAVMFSVAHAAIHSSKECKGWAPLANTMFQRFIQCRDRVPNTVLRYYANCVINAAVQHLTWALPDDFEAPKTQWPELLSEEDEKSLDDRARPKDAITEVAISTRTEKQHFIEKWHFEMSAVCKRHEDRELKQQPHHKSEGGRLPEEMARRYILKRVQELALAPGVQEPWQEQREWVGRRQIDRFGMKLQRAALHEFAGYVEDRFHPTDNDDDIKVTCAAPDYRFEQFLDPGVPLPNTRTKVVHRSFVPEEAPWWVKMDNPLPRPLTHEQRGRFVLTDPWSNPLPQVEGQDPDGQSWIVLSGYFGWEEPKPCWVQDEHDRHPSAEHQMWITAMFLPKRWQRRGSEWREMLTKHLHILPPNRTHPAEWLRAYPDSEPSDWGRIEEPRNIGAWVATGYYSGLDHLPEVHHQAPIPTVWLARKLGLRWSGKNFDFTRNGSSQAIVQRVRWNRHSATLIRRDALQELLGCNPVELAWHIHGWRLEVTNAQREAWAGVRWSKSGEPSLVVGKMRPLGEGRAHVAEDGVPWDAGQA